MKVPIVLVLLVFYMIDSLNIIKDFEWFGVTELRPNPINHVEN